MSRITHPPRVGQPPKRCSHSNRRRKPKAVEAIVQRALHDATDAGYARRQIALAMVETAGALVGVWDDADRRAVIEAMGFQVTILRDGIDATALAQLRTLRAMMALNPAIVESSKACGNLEG